MTTRDKSLGFALGLPSFSKTHFSLCATILREKGRGIRLYLIFLLKKNFMLLSVCILLNHIRWDSLFPVISWNTQTHFKEYYFCCLFGEFGFPLSKNVCHCIKKTHNPGGKVWVPAGCYSNTEIILGISFIRFQTKILILYNRKSELFLKPKLIS